MEAGDLPLSIYILERLLGTERTPRTTCQTRPVAAHQDLARVLRALGQSRQASSLNQLARSARTGVLPMTPDVIAELTAACRAVQEMRDRLILALGLGPEPEAAQKNRRIRQAPTQEARPDRDDFRAKLKNWRRIATRYDRCTHTFFLAICIAAAVIFWL